jgi:hypothetical protein
MAGSALVPLLCWSPQRLTLPPKQCSDYQVEVGGEIRLACGRTPRIGAYHQQATFRKRPQVPAGQMAQLAAHPVAYDCAAHGAAHHEADPGRIIVIGADEQMSRQRWLASPASCSDGQGELRAAPHPGGGRKHRCSPLAAGAGAGAGQTLTRARPLRRRAERTARPARVRMRSRNPCVLARRRLFGWNVRLLTGDSRYGCADKTDAHMRPRRPSRSTLNWHRVWPDLRTLRGRAAAGQTSGSTRRVPGTVKPRHRG